MNRYGEGIDPMFSAADVRFLRALRIHPGYVVQFPGLCPEGSKVGLPGFENRPRMEPPAPGEKG